MEQSKFFMKYKALFEYDKYCSPNTHDYKQTFECNKLDTSVTSKDDFSDFMSQLNLQISQSSFPENHHNTSICKATYPSIPMGRHQPAQSNSCTSRGHPVSDSSSTTTTLQDNEVHSLLQNSKHNDASFDKRNTETNGDNDKNHCLWTDSNKSGVLNDNLPVNRKLPEEGTGHESPVKGIPTRKRRVDLMQKVEFLVGPNFGRATGYSNHLPRTIQKRLDAYTRIDERRDKIRHLFANEKNLKRGYWNNVK